MKSLLFVLCWIPILMAAKEKERQASNSVIQYVLYNMLRLERELESTKSKLAATNKEVASLKTGGCSGSEISFEVMQTIPARYDVKTGDKLTFGKVNRNTGNGYDKNTGIFKAPAGGTYLFWAHIMEAKGKGMAIDLMKGGVRVIRGYTPSGSPYHTVSLTTIVDVKAGETIWLQAIHNAAIHGYWQTSFGGIRLCKH